MEDTADVDVDQSFPVVDRGVPQVAELLDARVVDQQPDWTDVAVGALGEGLHGIGVAHVALHGRRHTPGRDELVP